MINPKGRRGNYREKEKWLPLKNTGHMDLLFHVFFMRKIFTSYDQAYGQDCPQVTMLMSDNNAR